jgi:hypothetical protein
LAHPELDVFKDGLISHRRDITECTHPGTSC